MSAHVGHGFVNGFCPKPIVPVIESCQLTFDFLLTKLKLSTQACIFYRKIFLHTFCSLSEALPMLILVKVALGCASARSYILQLQFFKIFKIRHGV